MTDDILALVLCWPNITGALTHSLELDKEGLMPHRSASTSAVRPCG